MDFDSITSIKERAKKSLQELSKTIHNTLKPSIGPYDYLYHNVHSLERNQYCYRIVKRLYFL